MQGFFILGISNKNKFSQKKGYLLGYPFYNKQTGNPYMMKSFAVLSFKEKYFSIIEIKVCINLDILEEFID